MNVADRIGRLASRDDCEFELVLRLEDIRWLTGFTGGTAQLIVNTARGESWLLVDGRYVERAQSELAMGGASTSVVPVVNGAQFLDVLLEITAGSVLGVDLTHLTAAHLQQLQQRTTVVAIESQFDAVRRIKDENEIRLISDAARVADMALQSVVSDGLVGKSERQIRNRLDQLMREGGADDVAFETIVATGPNGARPHHEPSHDIVENGHGVIIDMGAMIEGYRSDMTRTVLVGSIDAQYRKMFDTVIEAQARGVEAVHDGVAGSDVDAAVRRVFAREGLEHEYPHGTGHGIGLYIHEQPILSPRCTAVLQANEVVTVEPGLYRGGVGGVRIEDLVVVTGTTCRTLSLTPKDLTCPRSPQTI